MGKVIIFSAPSGSGKTTIVRRLLARYPQLEFSISATSRAPRGEERDGTDYYFLPQEEFMRAVAENLHIATDDGSEGFKGLVTALIGELIEKEGRHYDECVAIGPMIMMKFVALTTKKYALKTTVSLNALMVDGTGMCGACRVTVGGRTRFTCVDGPEFDAHEVDFDEAMRRQGMYRTQEQRAAAIEAEREAGHVCKIGLDK